MLESHPHEDPQQSRYHESGGVVPQPREVDADLVAEVAAHVVCKQRDLSIKVEVDNNLVCRKIRPS